MPVGPFLRHTGAAIRSAVEVNLCGVINGCRLALPEMVAPRRTYRQHRLAGRHYRRPRPGPLRGNEVRGGGLSTALADGSLRRACRSVA